MEAKQINVVLPLDLAKRIKIDSIEMNVSLNEYAIRAFSNFVSKPIAARRSVFEDSKKKTLGRRIQVANCG